MIARIKGTLVETYAPFVLVDVGGVGYELEVPMSTYYDLPKPGSAVELHTHFAVREDAQLLYGFLTRAELASFRLLLKVNGIGAKTALAVLSSLPADVLAQAVAAKDTALITKVPGIGKKTAERLVLELADKMGTVSTGSAPGASAEILNALVGLGYTQKEASAAVRELPRDVDVAEGIRLALQSMVK